jgi:hypothetical protein
VQLSELAQFSVCAVALLEGGECDDAVRCPFVWSEDGRLGVLANKGKLCEVVVLRMLGRISTKS